MIDFEPKCKKLNIDLKDVKRLAKQGSDKYLSKTLAGASAQQLVVTFLRELEIRTGGYSVRSIDLYAIFKEWCEFRRADEVPTKTNFGLKIKGLISKKRSGGGNKYLLNKDAAEIRAFHERQKRDEIKKAKKEAKKITEEQKGL